MDEHLVRNSGRQGARRSKPISTAQAVHAMLEGDALKVTRKLIDAAIAGETGAARIILDRVAPARKEATFVVELPPFETPQDAPAVIAALLAKVADGQLAPAEARSIAALLEAFRRQSELADIEARLSRLEKIDGKTR